MCTYQSTVLQDQLSEYRCIATVITVHVYSASYYSIGVQNPLSLTCPAGWGYCRWSWGCWRGWSWGWTPRSPRSGSGCARPRSTCTPTAWAWTRQTWRAGDCRSWSWCGWCGHAAPAPAHSDNDDDNDDNDNIAPAPGPGSASSWDSPPHSPSAETSRRQTHRHASYANPFNSNTFLNLLLYSDFVITTLLNKVLW